MRDHVVIFVHVPKTAGATIHRVLEREHPRGRIETVRMLDRPLEDFPAMVDNPSGLDLAVIKGHVPYGVHRYLARSAAYVTMLRDPVERVRSLYQYARTEPGHPLHAEIRARGMTLQEFVSSGIDRDQTDNGQVRQIVGSPSGALDRADLALARERVEDDFVAVGVQEEFDVSLLLWRRALGWRRPPVYVARNVSRGAPTEVTAADRSLIEQHNLLDRELHTTAADLVRRRRAAARGLETELALFRMVNRTARSAARVVRR